MLIALGGASSGVLAGCVSPVPLAIGGPSGSPSSAPATSAVPTPTPSLSVTSATPTPVATFRPLLTREEVVARFSGRAPREWDLHVTGTVNTGRAQATAQGLVALTFDACGGKGGNGYDAALIATLRQLKVPATLMLNARWITENLAIAQELGADPLFEIQSHGSRHLPLSVNGNKAYGSTGTLDVGQVYDELVEGNATIESVSHAPVRFFRPGTAYCDDVAAAIALAVGLPVVDFSLNGDAGTTFTPKQIVQEVGAVKAGDIVISHMNHPEHGTAAGYAQVLPHLLARGVKFAHLTQVG